MNAFFEMCDVLRKSDREGRVTLALISAVVRKRLGLPVDVNQYI